MYYDEVRVCLCVTKNHHFLFARAERWRRKERRPLGRLWPSDHDDDHDDDLDDGDFVGHKENDEDHFHQKWQRYLKDIQT